MKRNPPEIGIFSKQGDPVSSRNKWLGEQHGKEKKKKGGGGREKQMYF